jgi:hypothetical protein
VEVAAGEDLVAEDQRIVRYGGGLALEDARDERIWSRQAPIT